MRTDPESKQGATGTPSGEVTELLSAVRRGDQLAVDRLFELVYSELHGIARARRREWRGDETINTTALIHEAYFKLTRQKDASWSNRKHFYATASKAMRHVLITYAKAGKAKKRGGDAIHLPLEEVIAPTADAVDGLIELDLALERLAELNPRQADVVECRFFGGLGAQETAEALDISRTTVRRDWAVAAAWLRRQLAGNLPDPEHDA